MRAISDICIYVVKCLTLNYSDIELESKQVHVASIADFSRQNIYIYINKRKWNLTDTKFKKDIRPNLKSFIS